MGLRRFDGILFTAIPGDHEPMHFHATLGGHEVIVELVDGELDLADRKDAVRGATRSEVRRVVRAAKKNHAALESLWMENQP